MPKKLMLRHIDRWPPIMHFLGRSTQNVLPRVAVRWIQRMRGRPSYQIPLGSVRFGDLKRLFPIGHSFGWERGTPIDRYYIEGFLVRNAENIRGRVLEAGDNRYTSRIGGARVEQSDILAVEATNGRATIVGDLTRKDTLPEAAFDCIILTQTLQYIFDLRTSVAMLYRALKPGGVLLITTPGVTAIEQTWSWYWTFTTTALHRLLEEPFGRDAVSVEVHGNIFAATAFLYGIATEELEFSKLNAVDSTYPVTVAARAIKREDP